VGPAVVRNRLRRQIRSILYEQQQASHLAEGSYLFGAHPSVVDLDFAALREEVIELLTAANSTGSNLTGSNLTGVSRRPDAQQTL
jgi:ribonuclease P protein component